MTDLDMRNDHDLIRTTPRTRARVAERLAALDHVREAYADESEPLGCVVVRVDGLGIPPTVAREIADAGLTIMPVPDQDYDEQGMEFRARNILWRSRSDADRGGFDA